MSRNDGNKQKRDLEKTQMLTKKNLLNKKELLEEFSKYLTPEEQNRAKVKINNKMRVLKHMKNTQ